MLFALALLVFGAYRIVSAQVGMTPEGEKTERWLSGVIQFRQHLYANDPIDPSKPTLWIVAGSNALFGVDSAIIKSSLGVNVRNYALQGSVHLDLLMAQVVDQVRPGDVVFAPMEFGAYDRKLGNVFDYSNYFGHLSRWIEPDGLGDKYALYASVPLRRWWDGIAAYIFSPAKPAPTLGIETMAAAWQNPPENRTVYSFLSLSRDGDFNIDQPMTEATWSGTDRLKVPNLISGQGANVLRRWDAELRNKGVRFALAWPILLEDRFGTLTSLEFWESAERHRQQLDTIGVPLNCDPSRSVFGKEYRFDTIYHANRSGAQARTLAAIDCIRGLFSGESEASLPIAPQAMVSAAADVLGK